MKSVYNEIWFNLEMDVRYQLGEQICNEVWDKAYSEIENPVFLRLWEQIYRNIPVDNEA